MDKTKKYQYTVKFRFDIGRWYSFKVFNSLKNIESAMRLLGAKDWEAF